MGNLVIVALSFLLAYYFGVDVGFRYWHEREYGGAAFAGGISVFMVSYTVGLLVVLPIARKVSNAVFGATAQGFLALKRKANEQPAIPAEQLKEKIENGTSLEYHGLVNRDFNFQDGGRTRSERLRVEFSLERNTLTMPARERLFVRILHALKRHGLPADTFDRMQFAMVWGDGRGQIREAGKISGHQQMIAQNNLKSHRTLVSDEAMHRDATVDSAITEMAGYLLHYINTQKDPPDDIRGLYQEIRRTGG